MLQFPPGLGIQFKAAMEHFIEQLRTEIPKTFHSPNHQERMQRILNEGLERESKAFTELNTKAQSFNFTVNRTKEGLATIPIVDGKSIGSKEYAELSDEQRAEIDCNRKKLDPLVLKFMDTTRKIELSIHAKVQKLIRSMGKTTIDHFIKPDEPFISRLRRSGYLKALTEHILENIPSFIPDETERRRSEREKRDPMIEYQVNLLTTRKQGPR